ncbi:hypothetical protein Tco_0053739, partial [Tanacetum coccineum]
MEDAEAQRVADQLALHKTLNDFAKNYPPRATESDPSPSHHNLQKVEIYCDKRLLLERIDVDAPDKLIHVEELKMIQSPPYKLEHVELKHLSVIRESPVNIALVDAVLWCYRPQSLTLQLGSFIDTSHIAKYTYEKLLQQEDEGQTNIQFVLVYFFKDLKQHFSDLNSLLKALSLDQSGCRITFIKDG